MAKELSTAPSFSSGGLMAVELMSFHRGWWRSPGRASSGRRDCSGHIYTWKEIHSPALIPGRSPLNLRPHPHWKCSALPWSLFPDALLIHSRDILGRAWLVSLRAEVGGRGNLGLLLPHWRQWAPTEPISSRACGSAIHSSPFIKNTPLGGGLCLLTHFRQRASCLHVSPGTHRSRKQKSPQTSQEESKRLLKIGT